MLKLKHKFGSKKRLNSASSSTVGSISDLSDRVIMLCEEIPTETTIHPARCSHCPGNRSSRCSHSEERESGSESQVVHLSRDRSSNRHVCYVDQEQAQSYRGHYVQRVTRV